MADYAISSDGFAPATALWRTATMQPATFFTNVWTVAPAPVLVFKMRGMDALVTGTYDAWLTTGVPDYEGTNYHGALATPLRDVVVIDQW